MPENKTTPAADYGPAGDGTDPAAGAARPHTRRNSAPEAMPPAACQASTARIVGAPA